jgi:hypothetical protein
VAVVPPTAGTYFVAIRGTTSTMAGGYTLGTVAGGIASGVTGSIGFTGDDKPIMGEGSALSHGQHHAEPAAHRTDDGRGQRHDPAGLQRGRQRAGHRPGSLGLQQRQCGGHLRPRSGHPGAVRIVARGDSSEEPSFEALHVRIVSASNATVGGRAQLRLQIQDDDRGAAPSCRPDGGLVFDPAGLEAGQNDLSAIGQGTDGLWV